MKRADTPHGEWPAFPNTGEGLGTEFASQGMTMRDYFAAAALTGILANDPRPDTADEAAITAYEAADAMLKARGE